MDPKTWQNALKDQIRPEWAAEIDAYEQQLRLRKDARIEERVFAEVRLRRGAYGQRYDNGRRHNGEESQELGFDASHTKGPDTLWDAPGMQRIKIPGGQLAPHQLEMLCDLAEEYSDEILHVTTRQDIQLHYVHIDDTPDLMRRLAAVGVTTREACGNSVRNVTACPLAGVCDCEAFDVSPYAKATAFYLLGHPGTQDLGRKFKVSFSGCSTTACGLAGFHDIGCIAKTREIDGQLQRGFEVYVGGGLGPVPHASELLQEFVPATELLPLALAVCRVFSERGVRENRARARLKFVLMKSGLEQFKAWVEEARAKLETDERWVTLMQNLESECAPSRAPGAPLPASRPGTFLHDNVRPQRQPGYCTITIQLPLGDFTPAQGRRIADIARTYSGEDLRTTVEQNLLLRWVNNDDVAAVQSALSTIGLAEAGASGITDVTSCPGTDTCKLGISSSRGLAKELRKSLSVYQAGLQQNVRDLHIKCSGCFNSCGQHHVADIGFLGVSRNVGGRRVPHFQLVLGGSWENNGRDFGLAIGAIPSKRVPEVVQLLTDTFTRERAADESFKEWTHRVGRKHIKTLVNQLTLVGSFEESPELYRDWGDPRVFTIGDIGVGECAGEVISPSQFSFAESERLIFEAQLSLDENNALAAAAQALRAMHFAARAVTLPYVPSLADEPEAVARTFEQYLGQTGEFDAATPGGRFSRYFERARNAPAEQDLNRSRVRVEEAQMFLDAAHEFYSKSSQASARTA